MFRFGYRLFDSVIERGVKPLGEILVQDESAATEPERLEAPPGQRLGDYRSNTRGIFHAIGPLAAQSSTVLKRRGLGIGCG
jgi:hypothetical protein